MATVATYAFHKQHEWRLIDQLLESFVQVALLVRARRNCPHTEREVLERHFFYLLGQSRNISTFDHGRDFIVGEQDARRHALHAELLRGRLHFLCVHLPSVQFCQQSHPHC